MKKFATTLSVLAVTVASMMATVSAEVKIASVNMKELHVMFYKRVDVEARLQKQMSEIREEVNKRGERLKKLEQQLVDLQKQNDPTLSEQAVKKIREQMISIKNEYDAERQEFETFVKRRELAFRAIQQREISLLLQEIHKVVGEVAEAEGVDVVLDASANTQIGMTFPYVKPSMNITDRVAAKLNVGAPEGYDAQEELRKARGTSENAEEAAPADGAAVPAGGETVTPEVAK